MDLSQAARPKLPEGFDPARPAVVILHYGDPRTTMRLHDQLLDSDPDWSANVMVLDNAAPRPYPPERTWHRLEENVYWAGAFSWCVGYMAACGAKRLWFLNNDLYFASGAPYLKSALLRLARLEKTLGPVGLYSPAVLTNPYQPQMVARPGVQASAIAMADGIAPLVSLEGVRQVGGLDAEDNPYGYGVDLWLSMRLARGGWKVLLDHQVTIKHIYHSTAKTIDGFMDQAALMERDYLVRRLGQDYLTSIQAAKAVLQDYERL